MSDTTPEPTPTPEPTQTAEVTAQPMSESQPQVVYVAAPVPPLPHSNRLFGSLIALVGAVAFALVYAGALAITVAVAGGSFPNTLSRILASQLYWVPILFFLVAIVVYFGSIGLLLLLQGAVTMTPEQAGRVALGLAVNPGVVIAAIVAREISLWFGLAISTRGRKVTARNAAEREAFDAAEARKRAEYERAAARA